MPVVVKQLQVKAWKKQKLVYCTRLKTFGKKLKYVELLRGCHKRLAVSVKNHWFSRMFVNDQLAVIWVF